jgi:hypothetical protein
MMKEFQAENDRYRLTNETKATLLTVTDNELLLSKSTDDEQSRMSTPTKPGEARSHGRATDTQTRTLPNVTSRRNNVDRKKMPTKNNQCAPETLKVKRTFSPSSTCIDIVVSRLFSSRHRDDRRTCRHQRVHSTDQVRPLINKQIDGPPTNDFTFT